MISACQPSCESGLLSIGNVSFVLFKLLSRVIHGVILELMGLLRELDKQK